MTTHCQGCGRPLDDHAEYCMCGRHFHAACREDHEEWCPREGTDAWVGAVEF